MDHDLIASLAHVVIKPADALLNRLWWPASPDLKVIGWGWFHLQPSWMTSHVGGIPRRRLTFQSLRDSRRPTCDLFMGRRGHGDLDSTGSEWRSGQRCRSVPSQSEAYPAGSSSSSDPAQRVALRRMVACLALRLFATLRVFQGVARNVLNLPADIGAIWPMQRGVQQGCDSRMEYNQADIGSP